MNRQTSNQTRSRGLSSLDRLQSSSKREELKLDSSKKLWTSDSKKGTSQQFSSQLSSHKSGSRVVNTSNSSLQADSTMDKLAFVIGGSGIGEQSQQNIDKSSDWLLFSEDGEGEEDVISSCQSPRSSTFSELVEKMTTIPLRQKPAYSSIIKYVKQILEELVSRNEENVLSHFGEWSTRVINQLRNTYGVHREELVPTAHYYVKTLRSFTFNWKDAIEEYIHEYGVELLGEEGVMEKAALTQALKNDEEQEGENGAMRVDDVIIQDDDWDEGGYVHYLDRKTEPKEPPYDEFECVTLDQMTFLDEIGIGLPQHEQWEVHMAMLRLAKVRDLIEVKFWGKIFGLYQDYYIAEAVMKPKDMAIEDFEDLPEYEESDYVGEYCEDLLIDVQTDEGPSEVELDPNEIGGLFEEEIGEERELGEIYGEFGGEYEMDETVRPIEPVVAPSVTFEASPSILENSQVMEMPVSEEAFEDHESIFELEIDDGRYKGKWSLKNYKLPPLNMVKEKPVKLPPMEIPGAGTNKHVFFVTNNANSDWIRLPHVTPEQIVVARQIKKFFTGYLTSRVNSYPTFPGIEMNLLRAQIARISAGTQVSPAGYFRFDEGEEETADAFDIIGGFGAKVSLNRDFEPLTVKDLTDPTCLFWVHHTEYILKQGRTIWYNINAKEPKVFGEGEEGMDDEGEEAPPFSEVLGEKGPPLLTSCAEDLFMDAIPSWTVKPSIELAPHAGCTYIRSNLWPGSYSFAFGRKIGFIYIGWGVKAVSHGYTPPPLPQPQTEYLMGPQIIEITDPTPYQEEEFRLKMAEWLKKQEKQAIMMEGGEGGGEEEEEEADE